MIRTMMMMDHLGAFVGANGEQMARSWCIFLLSSLGMIFLFVCLFSLAIEFVWFRNHCESTNEPQKRSLQKKQNIHLLAGRAITLNRNTNGAKTTWALSLGANNSIHSFKWLTLNLYWLWSFYFISILINFIIRIPAYLVSFERVIQSECYLMFSHPLRPAIWFDLIPFSSWLALFY